MGLYLNVPDAQLSDRAMREHRNRVWWTAYDFDQLLASRLGQSASVQDGDIQVDLPSSAGLPENVQGDFADAEPLVAHIKLAELAGQITQSLYGRRTQKEPFSQRVQQALKKLQGWVQSLPERLQFEKHQSSQPVSQAIRSLRLSFNQVKLRTLSWSEGHLLMTVVYDPCNSTSSSLRALRSPKFTARLVRGLQ